MNSIQRFHYNKPIPAYTKQTRIHFSASPEETPRQKAIKFLAEKTSQWWLEKILGSDFQAQGYDVERLFSWAESNDAIRRLPLKSDVVKFKAALETFIQEKLAVATSVDFHSEFGPDWQFDEVLEKAQLDPKGGFRTWLPHKIGMIVGSTGKITEMYSGDEIFTLPDDLKAAYTARA